MESCAPPPVPAAGLANLGNTCYFNATMQMLAHCKHVLVRLVLDGGSEAARGELPAAHTPLSSALRELLTRMWLSTQGGGKAQVTVVPVDMLRAVGAARLLPDPVYSQNDAHELASAIIDRASQEMAAARKGPAQAPAQVARRPRPRPSRVSTLEERWLSAASAEDPHVVALFHGQMACAVACRSCGHAEASDDRFTSLSVAVPPEGGSVQGCLDAHMQPELVSGWRCPVCGETGVPAVRRAAVWRSPQVLLVCLKRFVDPVGVLRAPVRADSGLDLASLVAPGSPAAACGATRYRLAAAVCHGGRTQSGGHYWACARLPGTASWHVYDDTAVRPLPRGADGVPAEEVYLLAYERCCGC